MVRQQIEKPVLCAHPRGLWLRLVAIVCLPATNRFLPSSFVVEANEYGRLGRDLNLLAEKNYEKCVENLLSATSQYDDMFEVPAYLKFVEYQSNGMIKRSKFDVGILELVHIYWLVVCTVSREMCYGDTMVPVQDVMEFKENDGNPLVDKLCSRVDLYLERRGFTTYEPSTVVSSLPPASITSSNAPMQTPHVRGYDKSSEKPTTRMNLAPRMPSHGPTNVVSNPPTDNPSRTTSDVPTIDPTVTATDQSPTSQFFGLTSLAPTSTSISIEVIVEIGPYTIVFDAICLEQEFYQSAKNKSFLRSVFYDQAMQKLKEALNCNSSGCRYEIVLIASFDSFAFNVIEAKVEVDVGYSVYVNPLEAKDSDELQITSSIQQAINDLMLSKQLRDLLTTSTQCNAPSISPTRDGSVLPTDSPTDEPSKRSKTIEPSSTTTLTKVAPSAVPSIAISDMPSIKVSTSPSSVASDVPSYHPTSAPSSSPSSKYERCVGDLLTVASSSDSVLTEDAFLTFVGAYSEGALELPSFEASPVQIVQMYWFAVCSVLGNTNCNDGSTITFAQLLSFELDDGTRLVHETCESLDEYLFVNVFTRQPSMSPTSLPTFTLHPSSYPSGVPSALPSESAVPSVSVVPSLPPTVLPTVSLQPSTSVQPSHDPTLKASSNPSESPSRSALPSLDPTLSPSVAVSNVPSSSSVPSREPTVAPSALVTIAPSSPLFQELFQVSFSIEYLSQCVEEVIDIYVNTAIKDYLNCSSSQNCALNFSLGLNLMPFVCLDQVVTGAEYSCALVDLSFNVSFESQVVPSIREELIFVVQNAVKSDEFDRLINSESSCTPSSYPSSSFVPSLTPTFTPSTTPSITASLAPSRTLTSAPTYGDSISLYFSIEYLVNDVKTVLETSLTEIISKVIDNENLTYSLTVNIFERRQCLDPVDTFHKCAFVDVMLMLKSQDPLDSLRETLTNAMKLGLSDGSIDKLINAPSS